VQTLATAFWHADDHNVNSQFHKHEVTDLSKKYGAKVLIFDDIAVLASRLFRQHT